MVVGRRDALSQVREWDPNSVEIYLHTVEVGDLIFNNFGHTALRLYDPKTGRDLIYNWGIFNFGDPVTFSLNFYSGILDYQLGIYRTSSSISRYKREGRTVWEDRLLLTQEETTKLLKRLAWNSKRENRVYSYDYFFDNCSTKPRDYFDEALEGGLKKSSEVIMTGKTFRDMVRSHYRSVPFVEVGLEVFMNGRLEREMTVWQEMFLPKSLRRVLLDYRRPDGSALMEPSRIIVEFDPPVPYPVSGQILWSTPFLAFLLFCLGKLKSGPMSQRFRVCLGISGCFYFVLTGLMGILLPLNWALSEHLDLHANWNSIIIWPVQILWVIVFYGILFGKTKERISKRFFELYLKCYVSLGLIASLLWFVGFIEQDISYVLAAFLPVTIGFMYVGLRALNCLVNGEPELLE